MSVYLVKPYQNTPITYYVDQSTHDTYIGMFTSMPFLGNLVVGTQADAQAALTAIQATISGNTDLFSQTLVIESPGLVTVRALASTDPENSTIQVFNPLTGTSTTYNTRTDANNAVQANIQAYLKFYGLDQVQALASFPFSPPKAINTAPPGTAQPKSTGAQTV